MGRPLKLDADWFRHDKGMRNDSKILALRHKYGLEGYSVFCMMLETICDADGFFVVESPLNYELWAGDFDIAGEKVLEIMDYCVKLGLFIRRREPGENHDCLSSRRMKREMDAFQAARTLDREAFRRRKYTPYNTIHNSNGNGDPLKGSPISIRPANQDPASSVISEPQFQSLKASMPWTNPHPPALIPQPALEPDFPALTPEELAEVENS
jgi:hypothetical protein